MSKLANGMIASLFITLAIIMGVQSTIAFLNDSLMWDWKNGMMSYKSGFIHMGIFLLLAMAPLYSAIKTPKKRIP